MEENHWRDINHGGLAGPTTAVTHHVAAAPPDLGPVYAKVAEVESAVLTKLDAVHATMREVMEKSLFDQHAVQNRLEVAIATVRDALVTQSTTFQADLANEQKVVNHAFAKIAAVDARIDGVMNSIPEHVSHVKHDVEAMYSEFNRLSDRVDLSEQHAVAREERPPAKLVALPTVTRSRWPLWWAVSLSLVGHAIHVVWVWIK